MTNTKNCNESVPVLLSIGCLNVDVICNVERLPARGQRMMSDGINRHLGGMSTNLACAAAHLGEPWPMDVEVIAAIGNDGDGRWVEEQLRKSGVSCVGLDRATTSKTCHCVILVQPDGERTIVSEPSHLSVAWVDGRMAAQPIEMDKKLVHVDGYHALTVAPMFAEARSRGWRTSLDTDELLESNLTQERFVQLALGFDLIFINRNCAQILTQSSHVNAMSESLRRLAERTQSIFLLTLGGDGVCVIEPGVQPIAIPALDIETVDTTGAGDVFAGTFLSCWMHDLSVVEAARNASIAGGLATQATGALGSIPTGADVIAMRR